MRDINTAKLEEAWQVERLVEQRSDIAIAADPSESWGKGRVDRDEGHIVAVVSESCGDSTSLDPLTSQDLKTRGDQRDAWTRLGGASRRHRP